MANGSISGARVSVHAFASDVLSGGRAEVEDGAVADWRAIRLEDGYGLSFTLSGDRTSLRLLVAGLLEGLQPAPDPEVPDVEP
ncbi:MAG TPA: hypothetical protein VGJ54_17125 [Streptosporangiaceae bacterium]